MLEQNFKRFLDIYAEFSGINLSDFTLYDFLAHTPNETLLAHSNLTYKYYLEILKSKNLCVKDLLKRIDSENFELLNEMFESSILLHDIGKINPYFQAKTLNNPKFVKFRNATNDTSHSEISSKIFRKYFLDEISVLPSKTRKKFKFLLNAFRFVISKHHTNLLFKKDDLFEVDNFKPNIDIYERYIVVKLLFSLLIAADFYATMNYKLSLNESDLKNFGAISNKNFKNFENNEIIKKIRSGEKQGGINDIRSEIFRECERNLQCNLDKNIFYLEAPTGSGKTLNSLNLALNLVKKTNANKIFYVFPFNTLVEQSKNVIENVLKDDLSIDAINSVSPIEIDENAEESVEKDYSLSYANRLFFHSNLLLMSNVAFFNVLFGLSKEDNFALFQLANSVVIIDEIQAYDNNLYKQITTFLNAFSKVLNIKFIIMSATLPKLHKLLNNDEKTYFTELLPDCERFFKNEFFKNRVELDFSLLNGKISLENLLREFKNKLKNHDKILIEFIKKSTAREFYELIKDDRTLREFKIYELSGDDNKAYRQFVIGESKKINKLIIVATQVIEAGVDIDMDVGFKDISTLDGEEQFLGRINRNAEKCGAKAYFFDLDDEKNIYKGDNRLEFSLKDDEFKEYLKSKNFNEFYDKVFNKIRAKLDACAHGTNSKFEEFESDVKYLKFSEIKNKTELIKRKNLRLYFPFKLDVEKYKKLGLKEFQNLSGEFLDGASLDGWKIWKAYKEANEIENYAKRKVELNNINVLMQFFTFNIICNKSEIPHFNDECGGYFLISDFEKYIKDDKFNRNAFNKEKYEYL